MAKTKKWVVTTSSEHSLNEVKKQLVEAGFTVDEVYAEIGSITGSASDVVAKRSRKIPGVTDISPEPPQIEIGPPNASITW